MVPDLRLGRIAPPELSHGNRFQLMLVGVLLEFRGGALTRSGSRRTLVGRGEQLALVLHLAPGVQDSELFEQLALQGRRPSLAFLLQLLDLLLKPIHLGLILLQYRPQ